LGAEESSVTRGVTWGKGTLNKASSVDVHKKSYSDASGVASNQGDSKLESKVDSNVYRMDSQDIQVGIGERVNTMDTSVHAHRKHVSLPYKLFSNKISLNYTVSKF
jgi:hypothetical protein